MANAWIQLSPGHDYFAATQGNFGRKYWHRQRWDCMLDYASIQRNDVVLDVGCGCGNLLERIPVDQKYGVDGALNQVEFARQRKLNVEHADATKLPFENEKFSLCFSGEVIEHLSPNDGKKMLDEMYRVLRPGGRVVLTTPNYNSLWPFFEKIWSVVGPIDLCAEHLSPYTEEKLASTLQKSGFEITSMNTLFLLSPFLGFSQKMGQRVGRLEKEHFSKHGMILLAVAQKK